MGDSYTPDPEFDTSLSSPAKQCSFLLGLLLESQEPEAPQSFSEEDWRKAEHLLEQAFLAYLPLYFPTQEELSSLPKEWHRGRRVAMASFLHFFNTGLLASGEQTVARIWRYLAPFDNYLFQTLGISTTQAIEICEWISNKIQNGLDSVSVVREEEKAARLALLDEAQAKNWSVEDLRAAATIAGHQGKIEKLMAVSSQLGKLQYADLVAAFPHAGAQFWQLFSVGRGEGPILNYPTDRSIADERPLIRLSDTEAVCPAIHAVFNAILLVGEQTLSTGERRDAYLRARDKALEYEAAELLRCMLGAQAELHAKVFETPDLHHEHDLVLIHQDLCLIVEMKASPPVEPFRDPEKAFVRLRHAFRAEKGIQKAYEQAMHLFRRLTKGESITLYDETGNCVAELSPACVNRTFCVCLTRDDYGSLATDLALLLEKEEREPYPWAINVLDLGALGEAWSYFGWGAHELREYLKQRIQLHGKMFADDELDFAGYYIQHGSFAHAIEIPTGLLHLDSTYSGVFDDIYRHLHHAGPPVKIQQTPPIMTDLRKSLMTGAPVCFNIPGRTKAPKVGRNKPCPCGSGRKYKKCCGR